VTQQYLILAHKQKKN